MRFCGLVLQMGAPVQLVIDMDTQSPSTNVAIDGPRVVSAGLASPSTNVAVDGPGVVSA
ncbi:hypothetical protein AVEN_249008-1, partial [Araneus ventricosus]